MRGIPDDFSEYRETPQDSDYANPVYYQQETPSAPRSAQKVQPLKAHSDYMHGPTVVNNYDLMSEYSGPSSLEGYTVDAGSEQREAAARGTHESSSKKRKGLAGLGGIGAGIGAL